MFCASLQYAFAHTAPNASVSGDVHIIVHGLLLGGGDDARVQPGQQRVARENRGGFAVYDMVCRFAAAQLVIVHCGQVVVYQGKCMYHFYCGGIVFCGLQVVTACAGAVKRERQHGAHSFSAREKGVCHRFKEGFLCQRVV